jgi:hypothetical protein
MTSSGRLLLFHELVARRHDLLDRGVLAFQHASAAPRAYKRIARLESSFPGITCAMPSGL